MKRESVKLLLLLIFCLALTASAQLNGSRQAIVSVGADWNARQGTIVLMEKKGGRWTAVGTPWAVVYGDSGMAWGLGEHPLPENASLYKREGDRRSPAGIFRLGTFCGYAPAAPAGVRYPYVQSTTTSRWVDDPQSPYYNTMIDEKLVPQEVDGKAQWRSAEHMTFDGIDYKYVLAVEHNPDRIPGKGSAIFLHLNSPQRTPTSGCTAMDEKDMLTLLHWLDPAKKPLLIQMPRDEYRTYMKLWKLPPLPKNFQQ